MSTVISAALAAVTALGSLIGPADHIPNLAPEVSSEGSSFAELQDSSDTQDQGSSLADSAVAEEATDEAATDEAVAEEAESGVVEKDGRPGFVKGGQLAVNREVARLEQEAGHSLVVLDFKDDNKTVTLRLSSEFNPDTDNEALDQIVKVLELNGFDQIQAVY